MNDIKRVDNNVKEFLATLATSPFGETMNGPVITAKSDGLDYPEVEDKINLHRKHKDVSIQKLLLSESLSDEEVTVYIKELLEKDTSALNDLRKELFERWYIALGDIASSSSDLVQKTQDIEDFFKRFPETRMGYILNIKQYAKVIESNDELENLHTLSSPPPKSSLSKKTFGFLAFLVIVFIIASIVTSN